MSDPHIANRSALESRRIDGLLAGYAAGSLDPYLHALVEAHLILSPENRGTVRRMEVEAGEALEAIEPAPMKRAARDHVLAAIYAGGWYGRPQPPKLDPDMPEPIARLVKAPLSELRWRFATPGASEYKLPEAHGVSASLIRVKPGRKLPHHTHGGLEGTLVLKGAFSDHLGHYRRGDVALADPTVDHRPVADRGEPCICFVVSEAPVMLTGPVGRLLQKAFGG